jgi:hypothetical protein
MHECRRPRDPPTGEPVWTCPECGAVWKWRRWQAPDSSAPVEKDRDPTEGPDEGPDGRFTWVEWYRLGDDE